MDNFFSNKITKNLKTLPIWILIIYITVVVTFFNSYGNTVNIIKSEYRAKINLIEKSISDETRYLEVLSNIVENDMQNYMEKTSYDLLDLYEKNPNVLEWDLQKLKTQFNNIDIYIINEDLEVISSSIEEEIGLSFSTFPKFSKTLKKRLKGNKFRADSLNYSFSKNELKKFSYMPTPDNKYLIELSTNIKDTYPGLSDLDILYLSKTLKNKYSFIEEIQVYRYDSDTEKAIRIFDDKDVLSKNANFKVDNELVKKAVSTIKPQKQNIKINKDNYTIKYIPYYLMSSDIKLNWWGNYTTKIVYNEHDLKMNIFKQKRLFIQNLILLSLLYFGFIYMLRFIFIKNKEMAYIDYLTKLPNRSKFEEFMKNKILDADKNNKIAVFFLDIDSFKDINDTHGHNVGDEVLKETGQRLKSIVPQNGIICRFGGDEFIAAISNINDIEEITDFGKQILNIFEPDFHVNSLKLSVKSSVGISIYPDTGDNIEQLISQSDTAMYNSKQNKLGFVIFSN